ncbi:MAG: hypothetical protein HY744_20520 [Deltaproteobacteria bacterium]|nr:hypothetical protein [Deltaproteobacteria bacterium]
MRWIFALLCFAALAAGAGRLAAQPDEAGSERQRAAARGLAEAGLELFGSGKYAEAIERFESAEKIVHAPPHLLFMARSYEKLGDLLGAQKIYERLVAESLAADAPGPFRDSQADGRRELETLRARIPALRIALSGAVPGEIELTIGGKAYPAEALGSPIPVNPGVHWVIAKTSGGRAAQRKVDAAAGAGLIEVVLAFGTGAPAPAPPAPLRPPAGPPAGVPPAGAPIEGGSLVGPLALLGAGVLGLGVGTITGVLALDRASELNELCPQNPCPTANEPLANEARTMGTVSTVSFIAGGLGVVGGGLWLLLRPKSGRPAESAAAALRLLRGPGALGVGGKF